MEKNNEWENDKAEDNQSYIDKRAVDLVKPMSEDDYLYKAPGKKMTPRRFLSISLWVVLISVGVLFVVLMVELLKFTTERAKEKEKKEAAALANLEDFLCNCCGLSKNAYQVKSNYGGDISFTVGDRKYFLDRGEYSDYLAEEFREKVKEHLTKTLEASELLKGTKFEVASVEFQGTAIRNGLLPITLTRANMDSVLASKTGENEDILLKSAVKIVCVIKVDATEDRTFSEEQFSEIEELWYVYRFLIVGLSDT